MLRRTQELNHPTHAQMTAAPHPRTGLKSWVGTSVSRIVHEHDARYARLVDETDVDVPVAVAERQQIVVAMEAVRTTNARGTVMRTHFMQGMHETVVIEYYTETLNYFWLHGSPAMRALLPREITPPGQGRMVCPIFILNDPPPWVSLSASFRVRPPNPSKEAIWAFQLASNNSRSSSFQSN